MKLIGRVYLRPAEIMVETDGCEVVITLPRRRISLPPNKALLIADHLLLAAEDSNKIRSFCGCGKEGDER
jgi:hypothetical protein